MVATCSRVPTWPTAYTGVSIHHYLYVLFDDKLTILLAKWVTYATAVIKIYANYRHSATLSLSRIDSLRRAVISVYLPSILAKHACGLDWTNRVLRTLVTCFMWRRNVVGHTAGPQQFPWYLPETSATERNHSSRESSAHNGRTVRGNIWRRRRRNDDADPTLWIARLKIDSTLEINDADLAKRASGVNRGSSRVNEWVEFNYAPHDTLYVTSEAVLATNHSTDTDKTCEQRKMHNSIQLSSPKQSNTKKTQQASLV